MGKSRKRQQAKRARCGAGAMDIDTTKAPNQDVVDMDTLEFTTMSKASSQNKLSNPTVVDMDTSEVAVKSKALSQNRLSKKSIVKRRAVKLRKEKAVEKALAMVEKKQQKTQHDLAKSVRKHATKKLY